jgi:Ca2+-transporting ATPase
MFQLINVFNVRSETKSIFSIGFLSNPLLFLSIIASIAAQCIAIYWPPMASVFSLTPLSLQDWLIIIPVALSIVVIVEADKFLRKSLRKADETEGY